MRVRMMSLLTGLPFLIAACAKGNETATTSDSASGVAAAATSADAGAARQAIDSANARFADAMKRGDTTAMASNYSDDAIVMMPGVEAWRGRDAVRKGFAGFVSQAPVKEFTGKTDDVMVAGDVAVETGTYEMTLQPKGGKEIKDKGKYLTIWKRQADGSWKIVRDINNSDAPAKM
jgi:uncharacterized protein (TIGR02246 family)